MKKFKKPFFINIVPMNDRHDDDSYLETTRQYVNKTKKEFFDYSLLTVGNNRVEPWVLAQALMNESKDFNPLIAVNPYYQHPLQVIKKLSALQGIYQNKMALNLIPGAFQSELKSLSEDTDFKQKQERLHDFSSVIKGFLKNRKELSYQGQNYQLTSARIYPLLKEVEVKIFFSGMGQSEKSGNEDSYFVQNIKPLQEMLPTTQVHQGLALGVFTRATKEEAFSDFEKLYPDSRQGQMLYELAVHNDDTPWNVWIKKKLGDVSSLESADFNLRAMKNFWSPAPFIVGSYEEVSAILLEYIGMGYEFFILDFHPQDFEHIEVCIKKVQSTV
jgi:alkanesulfonate monooxygenase SsuD/methylene tetrahydromethanopterin reductase-like flavin-dependent oxidoreductase (luciferase family)